MLFKVHAELFRKAFPLYGSELGSTHPALPKRYYCLGINKKHPKKNNLLILLSATCTLKADLSSCKPPPYLF